MKTTNEIQKLGLEAFNEEKKTSKSRYLNPLNPKFDAVCYGTGFHEGFMLGYLRCKAEMEGKVEKVEVNEIPVKFDKIKRFIQSCEEMNCTSCEAVTGHELIFRDKKGVDKAWTCTICGHLKS